MAGTILLVHVSMVSFFIGGHANVFVNDMQKCMFGYATYPLNGLMALKKMRTVV